MTQITWNILQYRHAQSLAKEIGDEFEDPDEGRPGTRNFRLLLNCEIVSGEDFDYDDLFVR